MELSGDFSLFAGDNPILSVKLQKVGGNQEIEIYVAVFWNYIKSKERE